MKIVSIILKITALSLLGACDAIAPGGLNGTEIYYLSASRERVIQATQILKSEQPEMCPPDSLKAVDGYKKNTQGNDITNWYYVYFYYPEKNTGKSTAVTDEGKNESGIILFFGTEDLSKSQRKSILREFEERVLNPIKEILRR